MSLSKALQKWATIKGVRVLDMDEAKIKYGVNTLALSREVLGALQVSKVEQIQKIVRLANTYKIPLYPISGGRNWGYGSALAATDGCVILDLSLMNQIHELNTSLGYVTLEPGVTQEQLYLFLKQHGDIYMVPTTGAGPTGSIVGNALERGFGVTPEQDHFASVLMLKAVLPNGEIYESALTMFGGHRSDTVFRWKIGPYLEGLFAQGNIGIVVQATIALVKKPESVTQFLVFINDHNFEDAVVAISNIKRNLGGLLGGVNIMNKRRLLSMIATEQRWTNNNTLSEMLIRDLAKKRHLSDWVVMGGIYCPDEIIDGTIQYLKSEFKPIATNIVFLNKKKIKFAKNILKLLPLSKLKNTVLSAEKALDILEGVPNSVALALAYLKNPKKSLTRENISPDEDGCGLIWYAPLLPIDPSLVRDYTQELTRVCLSKDIEPLITLTAISERCFDSTIPILFDKNNKKETEQAYECHELLMELSKEMGIFPYRLDINTMRNTFDAAEGSAFSMNQKIKAALDPNNIIAPGRYIKFTKPKK